MFPNIDGSSTCREDETEMEHPRSQNCPLGYAMRGRETINSVQNEVTQESLYSLLYHPVIDK